MKVTSSGIVNGIIDDRFGKRGTDFSPEGVSSRSWPVKIEDAPEGTVSFAMVLEDKDAFPVTKGFSWVHWTVANLRRCELAENESRTATDFVQGVTSWLSRGLTPEQCSFYSGMGAPDAPHVYELHVYALDTELPLENGFFMNKLYREMEGHILEEATLKGLYHN